MVRPYYSEGKQHQPQSSRTCYVHNKVLQTKDSATICTNNILLSFDNDIDEALWKPMEDFSAHIGKRTNSLERATGKFGLELKKRKRRHLGRMGNIKKVQNHEYIMFQKKAGMRWTWKNPNGVTKTEINYILTNRHRHQPCQHWKWPQTGYEEHQTGRRGGKKYWWPRGHQE